MLRRAYDPNSEAIGRARKAYPHLDDFCDDGIINIKALHSHIVAITSDLNQQENKDIEYDKDPTRRAQRAGALGKWVALADLMRRRWGCSHIFHFSHGVTRNQGGVCSAIKVVWALNFNSICSVVVSPGRCSLAVFMREGLIVVAMYIHLPPITIWTMSERMALVNRAHAAFPDFDTGICISAGDFNFNYDPLSSEDRAEDNVNKVIEEFWYELFPGITEVYQEFPTCKSGDKLSRLDKICLGIFTALLLDLKPQAHICGTHSNDMGRFSDHVPIELTMGSKPEDRIQLLPK